MWVERCRVVFLGLRLGSAVAGRAGHGTGSIACTRWSHGGGPEAEDLWVGGARSSEQGDGNRCQLAHVSQRHKAVHVCSPFYGKNRMRK